MARTAWLAAMAAVWLSVLSVASQTTPDFSGRWTLDPEPQPPPAAGAPSRVVPGDMGTGWGPTITITQDLKQLVVEYVLFSRYDLQPPLRFVYALDGSEAQHSVMMGHASQVQRSRTVWDGASLVITTQHSSTDPASGKPVTTEVRHRVSLESPTALVVEVTRAGVLGGRPSTTRKMYRKS